MSPSRDDEQRAITQVDFGGPSGTDQLHTFEHVRGSVSAPLQDGVARQTGRQNDDVHTLGCTAQTTRVIPVVVGENHVRRRPPRETHRLLSHPAGSVVGREALDDDDTRPARDDASVTQRRAVLQRVGDQTPNALADLLQTSPRL